MDNNEFIKDLREIAMEAAEVPEEIGDAELKVARGDILKIIDGYYDENDNLCILTSNDPSYPWYTYGPTTPCRLAYNNFLVGCYIKGAPYCVAAVTIQDFLRCDPDDTKLAIVWLSKLRLNRIPRGMNFYVKMTEYGEEIMVEDGDDFIPLQTCKIPTKQYDDDGFVGGTHDLLKKDGMYVQN